MNQYNTTGEFGINRYGPASGPQHIAASPAQTGGDGDMQVEQQRVMQGGQRKSQRQKRRSDRNKREKSQRGGKRSNKRRNGDKRRRSHKRQRGGK
jgi:hypothetical protein